MWEIDMDAVTDEGEMTIVGQSRSLKVLCSKYGQDEKDRFFSSGTETNNDFTTSWVKYSDAIANGTFQCHECDQHVSSKKAIKTHLGTMHNKELDEKEGSVLQVWGGGTKYS